MSEKTLGDASEAQQTRKSEKKSKPFDPENLIGQTLGGRYEVEKCIGRGGMGVVYLASQRALNRKVVVKVLPRSFVDDEEALARFEREARGMSRLQHPHIVSIYDFGREDDQAYICMEYVDGGTLSRRIKQDGSLSFDDFAPMAAQILQGIGEAHSLGLIHRDIKPSNIMLGERHGRQNYVKILDFGLAKLVKGAQDVTKEQNLVGSVAFLAPEQIMGNDIDQRVDVYALGVLFYYMLSGVKPFKGDDDVTVLYQHVHNDADRLEEKLPPGHNVPAEVIELIHRALSKDPSKRPPNANAFLEEFIHISGAASGTNTWSGSEMSGLFNLNIGSPEDPSGKINRRRMETPIGQIPAEATPSGSIPFPMTDGSSPSHSSQMTWVTGEHLMQMQKGTQRRNLLLIVLGLALAGVVAFAIFSTGGDEGPTLEELNKEFAQVEALMDEGKLGQADSQLNLIESDLKHQPSLRSRFVALSDELAIAKLMQQGEMAAGDGDIQGAVAAYKDVLSRDPEHQDALEKLGLLREEMQAREDEATAYGRLKIDSTPKAMVFLDDLPLGQTPIEQEISAGEHTLEVRKQGYASWSKTISIEKGELVPIGLTLDAKEDKGQAAPARRAPVRRRPTPRPTPEPTAKKPDAPTESAGSAESSGGGSPGAAAAPAPAPKEEKPEPRRAAKPDDEDDSGGGGGLLLPVEDDSASEDSGGSSDGLLLPVGGGSDDDDDDDGSAPLLD